MKRILIALIALALLAFSFWVAPRVGDPLTENMEMSR